MKRVLLVDDDVEVLECLGMFLADTYLVGMAENGADALALLSKETFDVVLLDLMMPVLDGGALLDELRRRNIEVPVILASASAGLAKMARQVGAVDQIRKPYDLEELSRKVARAVEGVSPPGSDGAARWSG